MRARRGSFVSTKGRETRKERATRDAPLVMMALVAAGTLNSSAAYFSTAVNGASSGTLSLFGKGADMDGERRGFRWIASRAPNDAVPSDGPGRRRRGARETTQNTYTRNGNLGSDVSVILKETFDMIAGLGQSCATRAIFGVPSSRVGPRPNFECGWGGKFTLLTVCLTVKAVKLVSTPIFANQTKPRVSGGGSPPNR